VFSTTIIFSSMVLASTDANVIEKADYVVVKKTERKLYLYRGTEVLKTYRIALGKLRDIKYVKEIRVHPKEFILWTGAIRTAGSTVPYMFLTLVNQITAMHVNVAIHPVVQS